MNVWDELNSGLDLILEEKTEKTDSRGKNLNANALPTAIWDCPGAGTAKFPIETYFRDVGARHFDATIIVTNDRFTANDLKI